MMNFAEKRKSLRFPVQLPVDFGRIDYYMSSLCSNISRSGLYIETSEVVDVGNKVTLFITFPHRDEPLKLLGKVMWKRHTPALDLNNNTLAGLGIQFIGEFPEGVRLPEGFEQKEEEEEQLKSEREKTPRIYIN